MVPQLIARRPLMVPFAGPLPMSSHRPAATPTAGAPGEMFDRRHTDQERHPFFYTCVVSLLIWCVLAFVVARLYGQAETPHGLLTHHLSSLSGQVGRQEHSHHPRSSS